jgi:hypothetical protein
VADVLIQHNAIHPYDAVMFEYKEPSLAFYQGGTIREYDLSLAQLAQNESEPWWVVTKRSIWEREAPKVRAAFDVIGTPMTGLDYSDNLTPVDIVVLRKR